MKLSQLSNSKINHYSGGSRRLLCFVLLFVILLSPLGSLPLLNKTAAAQTTDNRSDQHEPFNWSFLSMPLNSDSAIIVEIDHGIRLYEKQPTVTQPMPLVNHLMTAVLALEYLDENAIVTLSQEAAILADDTSTFTAGGRYPVEYLLLALLMDDSRAAAFALAEEISGSEESFITTMNNRATSLGMSSTLFTNATGLYDSNQYTNTRDLMILLRYALRDNSFLNFFSQRDNMYGLQDGSRHYFSNDFVSAWSFSDNTVEGAALSSYEDRYTAALLLTDEVKDITYAVVMSGPYTESSFTNNRQLIADLQSISGRISANYETSTLARRGAIFQSNYEIAGQSINLVFNQSVTYTHPLGDSFQESVNIVMNPDEMTLPLSTDDIIGYVEYHLSEGSVIRVDLSSDTVILAQNDTLNYILSVINANRELVIFILILLGIFLLIILWHLTRFMVRIGYNAWLRRQRGRSVEGTSSASLSEEEFAKSQSLGSALNHSLRSPSGTVPGRIARRYRRAKNLPDPNEKKFEENP